MERLLGKDFIVDLTPVSDSRSVIVCISLFRRYLKYSEIYHIVRHISQYIYLQVSIIKHCGNRRKSLHPFGDEKNQCYAEKNGYQHFLFFPYCFQKTFSLTFPQTNPGFYVYAAQVFLRTLWEKKLLIMSFFFFPPSVFYLLGALSAILMKFEILH